MAVPVPVLETESGASLKLDFMALFSPNQAPTGTSTRTTLALSDFTPRIAMTLCPIAIVAGCEKCPAFKLCPLKGVLGDQAKPADPDVPKKPAQKAKK